MDISMHIEPWLVLALAELILFYQAKKWDSRFRGNDARRELRCSEPDSDGGENRSANVRVVRAHRKRSSLS